MDTTDRRKRALEEATEWLVVLQGDLTPAQRAQFTDWLRESPVHVAQMLRLAQVHGALEHFERWARVPTEGAGDDDDRVVTLRVPSQQRSEPHSHTGRARSRRFPWTIACTTAVMLAVAAAGVVWLLPARGVQVIQTERAERREVALADGSVVQVDPETRLRVRYEERARYIFLEHGRALFHVAKNKQRPFLVRTQDATVRAVGTAFAVEQRSNSVLVTVAEGRVEVIPSSAGSSDAESPPASSDPPRSEAPSPVALRDSSDRILLSANQQVTVDRSGSTKVIRTIDSDRALAWAQDRLVFEYTPIGEAIRQFNKYNRIQLIVSDPVLADRQISGVFNASDPESFAAFIHSVASVTVTRTSRSDIAIDPVQ